MLILKQNAANTVPTPPAGKGTIFLNTNDDLSVKSADGNVTVFPTAGGANTQVYFNDEGSFGAVANLTFNKTTSILTVTGNVAATNVLTDNLLYANGTAWDLSDPGGANTQIQFNDDEVFGGSAAFTFNKSSNLVTVQANLNANNLNATTHITSGNVWANSGIIGAQTLKGEGGNISNIQGANVSGTVATATTAGTVTTAAQPNITSVGTLTSVAVTGNVTAGNVYANSGTIGAGTLKGEGGNISNIQAANVSGTVATASTVTTAAQPNITSVGTLTSLTVTGNAAAGNLTTGGVVSAVGNVSGGNVNTGGIVSATGNVSGGNLTTAGVVAATGNVSGGNLTTAGALSVTGNANVGNIGAAAGVFTGNVSGANLSTAGSLNVSGNAIITGNLTVDGNVTYVNVDSLAVEDPVISLGAGPNNTPLTQNDGKDRGTLLNYFTTAPVYAFMGWDNGNSEFAFGSNVGIVNDVISYNALGNVRVGNIIGNGQALTGLAGGNVTGQVGNALVAGTVYTNAQPNITSVGTLTSLNVTGNANVGNIGATNGVFTNVSGNGSALTAITGGNVTGQVGNALVAGTVYTAAQPNITSVGTLTSLSVTGKVDAGQLQGDGGNISNIQGGNVSGTVASATTAGTVTTAAQPNITSVGTLSSLTVTGNASAGNLNTAGKVVASTLESNVATGTAPLAVASTTRVANLNVDYANVSDFSNLQSNSTSASRQLVFSAGSGNQKLLTTDNFTVNPANAYFAGTSLGGTLTTAAQPNITSVGTLTSLGVTGNVTAGNVYANSGTIGAQTLKGEGGNISNIQGANVSGAVASATSATTAGTVTTAAQPNITSVGTLSSLSVTANVAAGNLTTTGVLSVTGTGVSSIAGNLDMTSNTIINLATPTNDQDAATKKYVDDVAQGLNIHDSCQAATPDTLANVTGGTITYNNGTAGVGATLSTTGTFNLIDGVNVQTAGTRILVKNEANAVFNGIYTYTNTTAITRALDYDTVPEVEAGDFVFITGGTLYDNTGWVQTDSPAGIGTAGNNISFTQFSGAGTYTAGTGLTLAGSQFNISNTTVTAATYGNGDRVATFTVNSQGQLTAASNTAITANAANLTGTTLAATVVNSSLTSVGTLGSLAVTGNATAGNVYANSGTIGASLLTGTLTTAAQPNITSVGTLSSLTVSGNASAGNLNTAGKVVASTLESNVATGTAPFVVASTTKVTNLNADLLDGYSTDTAATANTVVIRDTNGSFSANVVTANLSGNATTAGTVVTAAQPNITSVGTLTSLSVTGNITGGNLIGPHANGNSNVNIPAAAGNVNISVNGTANVAVVTATGVNVAGTLNATGNANVGNIGATRGVFTNIAGEGGNISNIQGANVSGTVATATTAGTVTTAAQPNITSVGTLTSLAVTGNVTAANFIGNFANGNSDINIPAANGNINFDIAGTANVVVMTGTGVNVAGTLNATGNANVGNIGATRGVFTNIAGEGGNISNIQGANVSGAVATATNAGTVTTAAQPNITSVGTLTSLAVTGNVTAGNIVAPVANGNSSLTIPAAAGNVNISVNGTANVAVVTATGVNVAGTLNATGAGTIGGDLAVSGNAVITGNLAVNGNLTYLNVDTLSIEDPIIQLQTGANGAAPVANSGKDVGTGLNYYDTAARVAFMGWDVSNAEFGMASVASIAADVVTFTTYGNLRVGNIIGNGQALTGLAGANVTGQVANALVAGTVYTAAQPNITSVGTLSSLAVTANVTAGNVYANSGTIGASLLTGTLTTAAQPNITSVGTLTSLSVTGNVTAGNLVGIFANGNSTIAIPAANGNINLNAAGAATPELVVTATGANITGTLGVTGIITGSANISGTNVISSAYQISSVNAAVSAAGTAQGNATVLASQFNVVSTVASGAGVQLPSAVAGMRITVINTSANALLVYPASTGIINSAAANAAYSQPAGARLDYISTSGTQWYTLNATYG